MDKLAIIVPVYNEEKILFESIKEFNKLLNKLINDKKISNDSVIVFVDDGSKDSSWDILNKLNKEYENVNLIKLSRNFGQQNAILAGLFNIEADMYITVDVDLQEDINAIPEMVQKYYEGNEIVYGVRMKRDEDSFMKRFTAEKFYDVSKYMGMELIKNHSEYRLLSKRAVQALKNFPERNLFLKGIIPLIGFKHDIVYYERRKRIGGESKYSYKKLFSLAWEGITSFSTFPLKIITITGFLVSLFSFVFILWVLYNKFFTNTSVPGWASTTIIISFIGGVQIFSLGIIGEYIGKIYKEVKRRPIFIIDKIIKKD